MSRGWTANGTVEGYWGWCGRMGCRGRRRMETVYACVEVYEDANYKFWLILMTQRKCCIVVVLTPNSGTPLPNWPRFPRPTRCDLPPGSPARVRVRRTRAAGSAVSCKTPPAPGLGWDQRACEWWGEWKAATELKCCQVKRETNLRCRRDNGTQTPLNNSAAWTGWKPLFNNSSHYTE